MRIAYSFMIGDLFNYGHLKALEKARQVADRHICGVISDSVARKWTSPLICNYEERKAVIEKCSFVDEVLCQDSMDPTENLKAIRSKHPEAKLVLMQSQNLWNSLFGTEFIREIGGEIVTTDFYHSLSRDYMVKVFYSFFSEQKLFTNESFNDIRLGDTNVFQQRFSTKANTLANLKGRLTSAVIEPQFVFTVGQWEKEATGILDQVSGLFRSTTIVVRSSSLNEDALDYSNAGHYRSVLNVDSGDAKQVATAVSRVIDSYREGGDPDPGNQVLVQEQTRDVLVSGVLFTRNLWTNTPYYLINYDDVSSGTDTVTGGTASFKTEILRDIPLENISVLWRSLILAVREIESVFAGISLDIEFAIKQDGTVVIFQVRPLAANAKFHSLYDDGIRQRVQQCQQAYLDLSATGRLLTEAPYLSDMAFWNPAELIGDRPNHLDYSLFNHLIMKSNWNEALLPMGYTEVKDELQLLIGNKPYINTHHAFLCLLPATLPLGVKRKLLNFYNLKLRQHPELHDKVEFQIVHNCYTFDFPEKAAELLSHGFNTDEVALLRNALLRLNNQALAQFEITFRADLEDIHTLENRFHEIRGRVPLLLNWKEKLQAVSELIEDCRRLGIDPFVRAARMAFMGNAMLRSLRDTGALSSADVDAFMNSISTVATELDVDFTRLRQGEFSLERFLEKYGHLRPGTYDITKLPYRKETSYITSNGLKPNPSLAVEELAGTPPEEDDPWRGITDICRRHQVDADSRRLEGFIKKAIELREYFKFVYTKNISEALELIASIGEELGFSREELAHLDYYSIVNNRESCNRQEVADIWRHLIESRQKDGRISALLSLPALVFSADDFKVVPSYSCKPNFITDLSAEGEVVALDKESGQVSLHDKIVAIEKADPGYDWIFTKAIRGLVTKYGGAGSHMAIRCAEFSIPAAIGCGEMTFGKVVRAARVTLDCKGKKIHAV